MVRFAKRVNPIYHLANLIITEKKDNCKIGYLVMHAHKDPCFLYAYQKYFVYLLRFNSLQYLQEKKFTQHFRFTPEIYLP